MEKSLHHWVQIILWFVFLNIMFLTVHTNITNLLYIVYTGADLEMNKGGGARQKVHFKYIYLYIFDIGLNNIRK